MDYLSHSSSERIKNVYGYEEFIEGETFKDYKEDLTDGGIEKENYYF